MRHHSNVKKFGRETDVRAAFMRSLCVAVIENGKITTTLARAKAVRPMVEKLVTRSKENTLSARRVLISKLGGNETIVENLISNYGPKYIDRPGGYTRIVKLPRRGGDAAEMAIIEFV